MEQVSGAEAERDRCDEVSRRGQGVPRESGCARKHWCSTVHQALSRPIL